MPQEADVESYVATYWMWWVLAVVLVGAELFTGTFYLLAAGAAFALGGVVAWLGGSPSMQMLASGVLAVAGTIAAHQWRRLHAMPPPQTGLDVGQEVQVLAWHDNGTARVNYRGTQWDAEIEGGGSANVGDRLIIKTTRGNTLVLAARN